MKKNDIKIGGRYRYNNNVVDLIAEIVSPDANSLSIFNFKLLQMIKKNNTDYDIGAIYRWSLYGKSWTYLEGQDRAED